MRRVIEAAKVYSGLRRDDGREAPSVSAVAFSMISEGFISCYRVFPNHETLGIIFFDEL